MDKYLFFLYASAFYLSNLGRRSGCFCYTTILQRGTVFCNQILCGATVR